MHQAQLHDELEQALRRCGSGWTAAQAHGLLCSRLAVGGPSAGDVWLAEVLEDSDPRNAGRAECEAMLNDLYGLSYRQLAERQSEFEPLLPDDASSAFTRADALAHWCEGFLHGLVTGSHRETLKTKLASEPISDIIKDTLEITRATADGDSEEINEQAYAELVEYVRVAAQLTYEELAAFRSPGAAGSATESGDVLH